MKQKQVKYIKNKMPNKYDEFLRLFTLLYNTNCPIMQYNRKHEYIKIILKEYEKY